MSERNEFHFTATEMGAEMLRLDTLRMNLASKLNRQVCEWREQLLTVWLNCFGHSEHVSDVTKVHDEETRHDLEKYVCWRDGNVLRLRHNTQMQGTNLSISITPSVTTEPIYLLGRKKS